MAYMEQQKLRNICFISDSKTIEILNYQSKLSEKDQEMKRLEAQIKERETFINQQKTEMSNLKGAIDELKSLNNQQKVEINDMNLQSEIRRDETDALCNDIDCNEKSMLIWFKSFTLNRDIFTPYSEKLFSKSIDALVMQIDYCC